MNVDLESLPRPPSAAYRIASLPPPPVPPKDEGYRPNTASTRPNTGTTRPNTETTRPNTETTRPNTETTRPNTETARRFSRSTAASRKTIKYATWGRFAGMELSPQPSDDAEDPLWKKELNLLALLLPTALSSATKTALIPVNATLATLYDTPYSSAAALTAAPLIVSAFSGLACVAAAKVVGKRPVYLVSAALLFVGSAWGTRVAGSFTECMAARVFQGIGWGAFDALLLGSIYDTFFEHERETRITIYKALSTGVTWGAPLLGGLASHNAARFTLQFEITTAFLALALLLLAFAAPETTFDHAWSVSLQTPTAKTPQRPRLLPRVPIRISREGVVRYLKSIPPWGYRGKADAHTLLQAPRALIAPTTLLVAAATTLPYASLWALASTLALLFSELSEARLGSLMAGPFILSTLVVVFSQICAPYAARFRKAANLAGLGMGTALFLSGILSFGFLSSREGAWNYALLSFLLALFAAGSVALEATGPPLIHDSSKYTSSNMYSALRNAADMSAGATSVRALFAGVAVQVVASAVEGARGEVAMHAVGLGVGQVVVAVACAAVWVGFGERVRRWDGRVMGLVDLSILKGNASFFEHD